ncbi:hypothetical protein GOP47_0010044 [Adiantum capillus-veneris]|uniref:Aldehyde dehydrogenase domain-containing protein n=1 Tax=Adiantum capillus-veneris TaxID=13818 RepID=A0A9D4UU09_ADICA|nr:hypothetical protein GOP47_0010044 [Adiantum capillus-veneris]
MADETVPVEVKHTQLFIGGRFVSSISGRTFPTYDPRSGDIITYISEGDQEDVDSAVKVAREAFDKGPWPRMTGYERGRLLFKLADLLEQHSDEIVALEALDNGKPVVIAQMVHVLTIKYLRSQAGWADKIAGQTLKVDGPFHAFTLLEPIGVVGQILPWNFPTYMFITKLSCALTCGNTVVVKPAEQTPLSTLFCAHLVAEAGIPAGVVNVVPGYGPTAGAAIGRHMEIDKLVFTGSTEVGRLLMEASAKSNLKPLTLELGGKSPLIIFDDADVDEAVAVADGGIFFNMGQVCTAGSRVYVQEGVYDEFLEKAVKRAQQKVIGDPFKAGVNHGPQVDQAQFDNILHYIALGKEQGANLVTGGKRSGVKGMFVEPTIFADVKDDMSIARDEIFGPVMSVMKFKTLEEVLERANGTIYGLAAGVMTKNIDLANRVTRALKAGTVWVNTYNVLDPAVPFGGYKMSGFGRENGLRGLQEYMQTKSVITRLVLPSWL